jgi:hypothetical protein
MTAMVVTRLTVSQQNLIDKLPRANCAARQSFDFHALEF